MGRRGRRAAGSRTGGVETGGRGPLAGARLLVRLGPRPILVVGALFSAGGLLWFGQLGVSTGYWSAFFVPSVLIALGLGLCFTPLAFVATSGVLPQEAGLASGLVNTSRQIVGAVGLAALATVATSRMAGTVAHIGPLAAATSGYTLAFRISALIALVSALAAVRVPKPVSPGPPVSPAGAGGGGARVAPALELNLSSPAR